MLSQGHLPMSHFPFPNLWANYVKKRSTPARPRWGAHQPGWGGSFPVLQSHWKSICCWVYWDMVGCPATTCPHISGIAPNMTWCPPLPTFASPTLPALVFFPLLFILPAYCSQTLTFSSQWFVILVLVLVFMFAPWCKSEELIIYLGTFSILSSFPFLFYLLRMDRAWRNYHAMHCSADKSTPHSPL